MAVIAIRPFNTYPGGAVSSLRASFDESLWVELPIQENDEFDIQKLEGWSADSDVYIAGTVSFDPAAIEQNCAVELGKDRIKLSASLLPQSQQRDGVVIESSPIEILKSDTEAQFHIHIPKPCFVPVFTLSLSLCVFIDPSLEEKLGRPRLSGAVVWQSHDYAFRVSGMPTVDIRAVNDLGLPGLSNGIWRVIINDYPELNEGDADFENILDLWLAQDISTTFSIIFESDKQSFVEEGFGAGLLLADVRTSLIDWFFGLDDATIDVIARNANRATGTWPKWLSYNLRESLGDDYANLKDRWNSGSRDLLLLEIRARSVSQLKSSANGQGDE